MDPWTGHVLEVLDLQHSEVHHCRVLRWLLDPLAHHRLGAPFMRALSTHLDLHLARPERARVDAEVPHARSRADVVIREAGGSWTVVIEAKINAAEENLQAARLECDWPEPASWCSSPVGAVAFRSPLRAPSGGRLCHGRG